MVWNYFATGHAKRKIDGVGVCSKVKLKEQIKPSQPKVQNDAEMVAYLKVESNKYHAASSRSDNTLTNISMK